MKVALIRRWGPHQSGSVVDVKPTQGAWLLDRGFGVGVSERAEPAEQPASVEQPPTKRAYRRRAEPSTDAQRTDSSAEAAPTQVVGSEHAPKRRTRRKASNADS